MDNKCRSKEKEIMDPIPRLAWDPVGEMSPKAEAG